MPLIQLIVDLLNSVARLAEGVRTKDVTAQDDALMDIQESVKREMDRRKFADQDTLPGFPSEKEGSL